VRVAVYDANSSRRAPHQPKLNHISVSVRDIRQSALKARIGDWHPGRWLDWRHTAIEIVALKR